MLFIWVVTNSLANLFEINQSLLNCFVVKKVAFVISRSCSAPQCGGYLRDLALFDQLLYNSSQGEGQECSTRGRLFGELGASVFVVRLTLEAERKSPSNCDEDQK